MPEILLRPLVDAVGSVESALKIVSVAAKKSPKVLPAFMKNNTPICRQRQGRRQFGRVPRAPENKKMVNDASSYRLCSKAPREWRQHVPAQPMQFGHLL